MFCAGCRGSATRTSSREADGAKVNSGVCSPAVSALLGYLGVLVLAGALAAWFWFRDDI